MCEIATYCYAPITQEAAAAIRVHGFYQNESEARDHAQKMAREGIEVDEFVIQYVNTWFLVTPPITGTGEEEEEIAAPENDDRSAGRMGSVCDIRKSTASTPKQNDMSASSSSSPLTVDGGDTTTKNSKTCLKNQRKTLEDLLGVTDVPVPTDPDSYAACRERLAMLRAFERKLRRLLEDSQKKCKAATEAALELSSKKPEYLLQYVDRYKQVLAESGLKPEKVGIMDFLTQDLGSHSTSDN